MLTGIGLRNFKRYGRKGAFVPLGQRVTLLLGPNSAGKSSAIQALLFLKQSWTRTSEVFTLIPEGPEVRLGNATNLVHLQNPATAFELAVDYRHGKGGARRRLWIEARPTSNGGKAQVERVRYEAKPEEQSGFRPRLGAPSGVVATAGDPLRRGRTTLINFELSPSSLPPEVHPLLLEWSAFPPGSNPPRPEAYISASIIVAPRSEAEVARVTATLADRPSRPTPPPEPTVPAITTGSAGTTQPSAGTDHPSEGESAARWAEDVALWRRTTEEAAEWDLETPTWNAARDLVDRINVAESDETVSGQILKASPAANVAQAVLDVAELASRVRYLGPVRSPDLRWTPVGEFVDSVGVAGERMVNLLVRDASLEDGKDSARYEGGALLNGVNRALRSIRAGYQVEVWGTPVRAGPPSAAVRLVPADHATVHLGLLDVGSGIRQLLPVLTEFEHLCRIMESEGGSGDPWLLAIEQPELHLHPRLQGDLLMWLAGMERVDDDEDEDESQPMEQAWRQRRAPTPQVLLETHGEVMTLRAARLIRGEMLGRDEVICLAIDARRNDEPEVYRMEPSGSGWAGWPQDFGFFGERYLETDD